MYELGNKVGGFSAYALAIVMALVLIWVMFKYLNTSELND